MNDRWPLQQSGLDSGSHSRNGKKWIDIRINRTQKQQDDIDKREKPLLFFWLQFGEGVAIRWQRAQKRGSVGSSDDMETLGQMECPASS